MQSLWLLHTFSMLIHSPVLHLNMVGPSHALAADRKGSLHCNPNTLGKKEEGAACVQIRVTYVAAKLITEVRAVMFPVTLEGASNTGAIQTLELILRTTGMTYNRKSSTSKLENSQWSRQKLARRLKIDTEMISSEA